MNTKLRQKTKNVFEIPFFKLMNMQCLEKLSKM